MSKQFELFISQLLETNVALCDFTHFDKISTKVKKVSVKLNQLNYLIGSSNLKSAISDVFKENPKAFEVLELLIAVRSEKKISAIDNNGKILPLSSYLESSDKIYEFVINTGLASVFMNKEITNLVDYVFGIEVGLDSNARKNRWGAIMTQTVSDLLDDNQIFYRQEISSKDFPKIASLGTDIKRFDFVIKTSLKTYLIEANFYNVGGSKLNEIARSYTDIASKINSYNDFEFIWITDGRGWLKAKNKLEEAFNLIQGIYNLTTLSSFIEKIKFERVQKF